MLPSKRARDSSLIIIRSANPIYPSAPFTPSFSGDAPQSHYNFPRHNPFTYSIPLYPNFLITPTSSLCFHSTYSARHFVEHLAHFIKNTSPSLFDTCHWKMPSAGSILRQLSTKDGWKSTSKRWANGSGSGTHFHGSGVGACWKQMHGMAMYAGDDHYHSRGQKRVMVMVDDTSRSKHAMMWALTHITNKGDWLTLLHIIPSSSDSCSASPNLAASLASLCKACKPEVEVEAVVIEGPKLGTVLSQVKKLEVSVLVLGQKKPSPITTCLFGMSNTEDFVEQCINSAECLTIGVRKQSKGMGGYLISTRWQKNFWLLA